MLVWEHELYQKVNTMKYLGFAVRFDSNLITWIRRSDRAMCQLTRLIYEANATSQSQ